MLRKIVLTGVGLVFVGLARFAFNWIAINVFDEDLAGTLNVALSVALLAALPANTAFAPTALRFVAQARGQGREDSASWVAKTLFVGTVLVSLAMGGALLAYDDAIARSRTIDVSLVRHAIVLAMAYGTYLFLRSVLYAVDRVEAYTALELVAALVFFATIVALAVSGAGHLLLLAFAASYLTFAAGAAWVLRARWGVRRPPDPPPATQVAKFSLLALVGTASSLSIREIGTIVAADYASLAGTAHFAACIAFLTPMQFLPRMLQSVLFAHSAEREGQGELDRMTEEVAAVNHWLVVANVPLTACIVLLAGPVVRLIGSTPGPEQTLVLQLLAVATAVEVISTPAINALAGIGRIGVNTASAVAGLGLAVAVWAGAGPESGLLGLTVGYLASSVLRSVIPIAYARWSLSLRVTDRPATVGALLLTAGVAVATQQAFGHAIAVACVHVGVVLLLLRRELGELRQLVVARVRTSTHETES